MKPEKIPSVYDVSYETVYDITFDVLPSAIESEIRPTTVESDNDPVAPITMPPVEEVIIVESIESTPAQSDYENSSVETIPTHVAPRLTYEMLNEDEITFVATAITRMIETTRRKVVPTAIIGKVAFNGSAVSDDEYARFKLVVEHDQRLQRVSAGKFRILEEDDAHQPFWPDDIARVEKEFMDSVFNDVIGNMVVYKGNEIAEDQILGIVTACGEKLSTDEIGILLSKLSTDPRITITKNGGFRVKDEYRVMSDAVAPDRPLTDKQIKDTLKEIKHAPEMRQAADRALRKADTRVKGKNRKRNVGRMQGRTHGKKKTIDQLLAEMNKPKEGGATA